MSSVAVFDFSALFKLHRGLASRADDLAPTMQLVADKLLGVVRETWDTDGRGEWPPLAESTLAKKGSAGALRMLFETGESYTSVTPIHGADFAGAQGAADQLRWHIGDGPRTKIPKRDPFEAPLEEFLEPVQMILEALVSGK